MQIFDSARHRPQGLVQADAEKEGEEEHHQQVAEQIGCQIRGQGIKGAELDFHFIFCDRVFLPGRHEKSVRMFPDLDRVILQIPAGHGRNVCEGVGERDLLRKVPAPYHLSLLVYQHGKGIVGVDLFRCLGRERIAVPVPGERAGQLGCAPVVIGGLCLVHVFPDQIDEEKQEVYAQNQTYGKNRREDITAADFQQILHTFPSCSRRYPIPRAVRSHLG